MKKSALFILALVIAALLLTSCAASFPTKEKIATLTSAEAAEVLKDKSEKEIHAHWGTPDDQLSGFYGDVYLYNDKSIVIYYDPDGKASEVVVFDKQN